VLGVIEMNRRPQDERDVEMAGDASRLPRARRIMGREEHYVRPKIACERLEPVEVEVRCDSPPESATTIARESKPDLADPMIVNGFEDPVGEPRASGDDDIDPLSRERVSDAARESLPAAR
jgi:hypothetical protein